MVDGVHHLMGPAEIARLLGVSRQRVTQLVERPDFPKPTVSLAMGKVWLSADVRAWAKARGRTVTDED
jgi:predicted DNA-binding transcriptional regulator AlpA